MDISYEVLISKLRKKGLIVDDHITITNPITKVQWKVHVYSPEGRKIIPSCWIDD